MEVPTHDDPRVVPIGCGGNLSTVHWAACGDNSSRGGSADHGLSLYLKVSAGLLMGVLALVALLGNLLVVVAITTDHRLRVKKASLFLVSLATADILVALLVMPLAIVNDLGGVWPLGDDLCLVWTSFDVMCATASILHLCLICLDRFLQIQFALYYKRTVKRWKIRTAIGLAWTVSLLVSFLPILLRWHVPDYADLESSQCLFKISLTYALVSSSVSFYLPCVLMSVLYMRVFQLASYHLHCINATAPVPKRISVVVRAPRKAVNVKAAFTLGVIMGVFLLCWMPFFIVNPFAAMCDGCVPEALFHAVTWLGYANSCANPIIYSVLNLEFRNAFLRWLCICRSRIL